MPTDEGERGIEVNESARDQEAKCGNKKMKKGRKIAKRDELCE